MYKTITALALAAAAFAVVALCAPRAASDETEEGAGRGLPRATLHTNHGDIVLRLRTDVAPVSVERFVRQARRGMYDGICFDYVSADAAAAGGFLADGSFNTSPPVFIRPHCERGNPMVRGRGAVSFRVLDDRYEGGDLYFALGPHPADALGALVYFAQVEVGLGVLSHAYDLASPPIPADDLVVVDGVTLEGD